jgi:hypothetical protein
VRVYVAISLDAFWAQARYHSIQTINQSRHIVCAW